MLNVARDLVPYVKDAEVRCESVQIFLKNKVHYLLNGSAFKETSTATIIDVEIQGKPL